MNGGPEGDRARRGRCRPGAPTGIAWGFAGICACLLFVLGNTGSGWLVIVLTLTGGLLMAGFVLPWHALASVKVAPVLPRDAVAGRPMRVSLDAAAADPFEIAVPALGIGWSGIARPGAGALEALAGRRGVLGEYTVELRSAAPLGLWWWHRRIRCTPPRPLHIAPAPARVSLPRWRAGGSSAGAVATGTHGDELVRGVRDYVAGDPPKLVHWHASARTGSLVVRELEAPSRPAVWVVCELAGPPARAEETASACAGLVAAALAEGSEVMLATSEPAGPTVAPVETTLAAGRRLARAVPGPPGAVPPGARVVHASAHTEAEAPP